MIFQSISKVNTPSEKAFFIEKVQTYIRLVEECCSSHGLTILAGEDVVEEFTDIGVIQNLSELPILKATLGELFVPFQNAAFTVTTHREILFPVVNKLYNSYRAEVQAEAQARKKLTLVDFFCGAGGLSLGFRQNGFYTVLANDIEDVCIETYRYNHPEVPAEKVLQGDIKEIVDNIDDYISGNVDVVVGGPPCQGFSSANKNHRVIDDPRNKLYKYFVRAVEKIAPKFVVMENVKGMLKVAEQVVEDYRNLCVFVNGQPCKYEVAYQLLNSKDFSVAQSRERLIYIAIRSDISAQYHISPQKIFAEIMQSCEGNIIYTLADALAYIKPLEAQRERNHNEVDSEISGKKIDLNPFEAGLSPYIDLINEGREIPIIFNHKARYCSDLNYEIYRRLEQGDDATDDKVQDIMPYAHRNHCFKDKYYKLIADRPCRTITAHLRMDCHSHIHPYQVRSLTPREAARVQSFPDDYFFLGAYLKTYMQIGNAVPAVMARGIAAVIKKYLKED